jgi:hypothetical protein
MGSVRIAGVICLALAMSLYPAEVPAQKSGQGPVVQEGSPAKATASNEADVKEGGHEFSWERPGTVSIYDLQLGPAALKENQFQFVGGGRTFSAGQFGERLILMVKFSYRASRREIPLKFVIRLPESRQYEETVRLPNTVGQYDFHFAVHRPGDFVGTGFVYLYYGFSIVDVLDFTIMPGS